MQLNTLTTEALDAASRKVGEGPVVMINLIWFRDELAYPSGFEGAKPDPRSAYYEGYATAFRAIAREVDVSAEVIYAGHQLAGVLAGPGDDWDDVIIVRYESFADLRKIVESEAYARTAAPHRLAGVANWHFIATSAR